MSDAEPRKRPLQARSQATVEAILDATARVLVTDGYDRASTNRVARVAGVSVGSIYQYFPNKEALVLAVIDRHAERMGAILVRASTDLAHAPIPLAVRTYVRASLQAHTHDAALHRVIVQQVMHIGLERIRPTQERSLLLVRYWLEAHRYEILPRDLDTAAYVLVSMVQAVIHGGVLIGPVAPAPDALEDELVAVVLRYLLGDGATEGVAHGGSPPT